MSDPALHIPDTHEPAVAEEPQSAYTTALVSSVPRISIQAFCHEQETARGDPTHGWEKGPQPDERFTAQHQIIDR